MAAVIFDMDGVLIDSEAMYQYLLLDFFKEQEQQISIDEVNEFVGCSEPFFYQRLGELWKPQMNEKEMRIFYSEHFDSIALDYATLLNPHVKYILPQMKQFGLQTAIASSSRKESIDTMMISNGITAYFDRVVSGHEVPASKPDPAIYLETIRRLGVSKEQCVVIEDSKIGIEAAKRAGLYVIAKREVRFDTDQSKADYIADDLLLAWLHVKEHFHL